MRQQGAGGEPEGVWCLKFNEFSLRPLRISAFSAFSALKAA